MSLAVWMGGVAREMNLLQQASNLRGSPPAPQEGGWDARCRELYGKLLDLLDVVVTTDVLSGTSAGGINAALLGLSSATGIDLGGLRDLWLTTGSMDKLLRDPGEPSPSSLMQGDKVLFSQLDSAIWDFYNNARRYPRSSGTAAGDGIGTTVFITTTMMSGETSRFTDDYGTLVPDVDHHGLFTFDQRDLGADGGTPALTALALAARSSASFPGAFEPAYVPVHAKIDPSRGVPGHPDMADWANMTRGHWVADGGLLANRPLTPLLGKVFAQPATGQVRRVLAFVVPDGGGTTYTTPDPVPADDWRHPPTLIGALKADLNAQLSQSIASDLEAVRLNNERINTRYDLRRYLADLGPRLTAGDQRPAARQPQCDGLITGRVLRDFQRQQGAGLAQPLLAEVMRQLTTAQVPPAWARQLAPAGQDQSRPAEPRMAEAMVRTLGRGWQPQPARPPADEEDEESAAWAAWTAAAGDPYERAAMFGLPVFHAARTVAIHLVRLGYQRATAGSQRSMLAGHRKDLEAVSGELPPGWTGERGKIRSYLGQATSALQDGHPDLVEVAADLANRKRRDLLIGERAVVLKDAWEKLAVVVRSLLGDLEPMTEPGGRVWRAEAAGTIGVYLRYFGDAPQAPQVADQLLRLVLAERALLPVEAGFDQPVEFVQFSANTRTLLAPGKDSVPALDSANKLRGVELHHFAAFYKSSWRAWDWMWGRMDGSGWLVHVLLDPRRILAAVEDQPAEYPEGQRAATFAGKLRTIFGLPDGPEGECLDRELAFLDDHTADIPVSLPDSALLLAQVWQNLITASELPVIADRIQADSGSTSSRAGTLNGKSRVGTLNGKSRAGTPNGNKQNRSLRASPDAWVSNMLSMAEQNAVPADFASQLPGCPVRQETLAGELRTPAFAQLATKAAAVAAAAVSAAPETPGPVRPVLTSARTVTRTGYMAAKVTGGTGWKTLLAGVVLAVVGGVLATQGMIVVGLTGTIMALVGLYLVALGAWGVHRGLLGALVAITALALPALLTLHWVRVELWGTEKSTSGLVPRDVLPWLRDSWWAGLAVLGGIILVAVLLSMIPRRRPKRNRADLHSVGDAAIAPEPRSSPATHARLPLLRHRSMPPRASVSLRWAASGP